MKSALANIGESEKSKATSALENAGLKGDTEFIATNMGSFVKNLENLIETLSPAESGNEDDTGIIEDAIYLTEQLRVVISACTDYDDTVAYDALNLLKEKPWKKETSAALEKIRDMLFLHSDFEAAAEKARRLIA